MLKTCAFSGSTFEVTEADIKFYKRVSPVAGGRRLDIPLPTLCPEARQQRRLAWRNERTLYRRKCSFSGKDIVSTYAPEAPHPVYNFKIWYSDAWNPFDYAAAFDFNQPFFAQFRALFEKVPMYSLHVHQENENCDYANLLNWNKNCYYIFAASRNENSFYSTYLHDCRDISDCFFVFGCELCYECVDCKNCYNLKHSVNCETCRDSEQLINCRNCSNCFGCVSLVNADYCLFNEKYTKEQYTALISNLKQRPQFAEEVQQTLNTLKLQAPQKYYAGINNQGSIGDHLINTKNCFSCFDCTNIEDCKYCTWFHGAADCYDCYGWGMRGELGLENHLCGTNFTRVLFCEECWNGVSDLLYSRACHSNCSNLFGCIGLKQKSYCILNTAYTKHEYEKLVCRIANHMKETGEWGEFFPASLSPYGYNETVAQEYFPLSREEALSLSFNWRDHPLPGIYGKETVDWSLVPEDIRDIPDSICTEVFPCTECDRNFRITRPELDLYRKLGISLPQACFDSRYHKRWQRRNPRKLYTRACPSCGELIVSTYGPDAPGRILCEACYEKELY